MKLSTSHIILFSLLIALPLASIAQIDSSGKADTVTRDYIRSIIWGGIKRTFIVHIPKSYDGHTPFPAVLVYHSGGSNAKQWMPFCGLNETADKNNFIAVYPNGTGKTLQEYDIFGWNGGPRVPAGIDSVIMKVDDVGFTNAMLDDLQGVLTLDKKRIYATGMSMGAMMVYRLASELSNRIAAIVPIAGPMATEKCSPVRPVSIIDFHGTKDQAVPFAGGKGKLDPSGTDYISVDYSIQSWVKANGCTVERIPQVIPDKANDSTKVIRKTYGGCDDNAEVVLYLIEGGGHAWPGRDFGRELKILGRSTKDISANDLMWAFFEKHPMK